jgi:hypothetical protein
VAKKSLTPGRIGVGWGKKGKKLRPEKPLLPEPDWGGIEFPTVLRVVTACPPGAPA